MFILQDEWNRQSHPMKRDDFGVWEVTVPPLPSGVCAIPHDTKVKVGMHRRRFFLSCQI